MKEREFYYRHKGQNYLVRVNPDIAVRGGERGPGTTTSIWRVSDNPEENNENGVIPGVRGYQGRHSKAGLIRLINRCRW